MNPSEKSTPRSTSTISAEAIIGIGITVAWLGLLCVMLGWAQWLRHVLAAAWIWLPIGLLLMVGGGIVAMIGTSRKKRDRAQLGDL